MSNGILRSDPEGIKLSTKVVLLINLNLLMIADAFLLNIAERENFSSNKYENANYCLHFHIY